MSSMTFKMANWNPTDTPKHSSQLLFRLRNTWPLILASKQNNTTITTSIITSGDENHLCGASLRKSHKISLKAHRHACAHGVGTPIARPEKLP